MNFLTKLQKSIIDFQFYKVVRKESVGTAFLYSTKLAIIFGLISLINLVIGFNQVVDWFNDYYWENIPDYVFEDGELSIKDNQPFVWEEGDIVVAVDTSGQIGPEILDSYHEGFYISKDSAIFKQNGIEKREFDLTQFVGVKFTRDDVGVWIPYLKWINGLFVIFGLIGFWINLLWSALLVTLLGLLICFGKNHFSDLYKISIYALTMPILIRTAKDLLMLDIPWFSLIYYVIAGFYMWQATSLIKKDQAAVE